MVLYHLINFKASKKKPSFKEVIAQVIRQKKEDLKKQRKKKLAMLMGENIDDEDDDDNVQGLTKEQTDYIVENLGDVRKKFTNNNSNLI